MICVKIDYKRRAGHGQECGYRKIARNMGLIPLGTSPKSYLFANKQLGRAGHGQE
jgi:hypothetical protein